MVGLAGMVTGGYSQVTNTFDVNIEGWSRIEFTAPSTFGTTGSVAFASGLGNPGGAIALTDSAATGFAFVAPAAYHGDRTAFIGGEFSFDYQTATQLQNNVIPFAVAIGGPAGTIYSAHPNFPYTQYQRVSLFIGGGRNWRWNSSTGPVATAAQVQSVMTNVNRIVIYGDYQNGTDTTRLDNIYFGPLRAPALNALTFDANAQGVVQHVSQVGNFTESTARPVTATWGAAAGSAGGGLTLNPGSATRAWYLLPGSLTGDRRPWIGGSFSFDLRNTNQAGSRLSGPLLSVTSGGTTLVYAPKEAANFNTFGTWQSVIVPWETTPSWRVGSATGPQPTSAQFEAVAGYPEFMRIRAEYWDGNETNDFDNFRFDAPSLTTVTGQVDLGADYVGDPSGIQVEITPFRGVFPMETQTVSLNSAGEYSAVISTAGDVALRVKPSHWLSKRTEVRTLAGGTVNFDLVATTNGDVDGDNEVTVFDYDLLSAAFDTSSADANWNPEADLDGDGSITVFDYDILSANFDAVGE